MEEGNERWEVEGMEKAKLHKEFGMENMDTARRDGMC